MNHQQRTGVASLDKPRLSGFNDDLIHEPGCSRIVADAYRGVDAGDSPLGRQRRCATVFLDLLIQIYRHGFRSGSPVAIGRRRVP